MRVFSFKPEYEPILARILRVYELLDVDVNIYPYSQKSLNSDDFLVQGFLLKNPFQQKEYNIFMTSDFKMDIDNFLIHECAHIEQYEKGELSLQNGVECWMGKPIDFTSDYWSRKHEKKARKRARQIRRKIRKEKI
ncbi:MAG: hypothetical protein FK734_15355 [Asgard group archaeon]|nr:hypothetical protein [Asgard group archaeon]